MTKILEQKIAFTLTGTPCIENLTGVAQNAKTVVEAPCSENLKGVARCAFTLAEVLIVIGVIGVVSAITIPSLVAFFQEKVAQNRKEVIEDRLIQGMNQLNTLDDGFNATQYTNTEGFVRALSRHYKMSQICGAENLKDCFPYTSLIYNKSDDTEATKNWTELKTPEDFGLESSKYYAPAGFISAQGTPFVMLLKKDCIMDTEKAMRNIPTSCVQYMYDNNGSNNPNKFGSDLVNSEGIVIGKLMPKAILGGVKIMTNAFNGKAKNGDYWLGAKEYCESEGWKLPTSQQLVDIANVLYSNGTLNQSTVPEALFGLSSSWTYLCAEDAKAMQFNSSSTNFISEYDARFDSNVRAVCVTD
jgi:prepilin-type N-terminal cleavage/methylation domain-containing protein